MGAAAEANGPDALFPACPPLHPFTTIRCHLQAASESWAQSYHQERRQPTPGKKEGALSIGTCYRPRGKRSPSLLTVECGALNRRVVADRTGISGSDYCCQTSTRQRPARSVPTTPRTPSHSPPFALLYLCLVPGPGCGGSIKVHLDLPHAYGSRITC